jgi:Acetyltransferase (GNAT) domain
MRSRPRVGVRSPLSMVARLSVVFPILRHGFRVLGMPPLTRTLGPWVAEGAGKSVSRRKHDRRVTAELIEKLPRHTFFRQLLPPSFDNLLTFQSIGFCIGIEHVVEINGCSGVETLWNGLHHKLRSLIRRADQHQAFEILDDPEEFCRFYARNIAMRGQSLDFESANFMAIYSACHTRKACTILAMRHRSGELAAAIFLVWWDGRMHFLLQTRDPNIAAAGSVECLIWHATEIAAQRSWVLDLDGIPHERTVHRLLPFGGEIRLPGAKCSFR